MSKNVLEVTEVKLQEQVTPIINHINLTITTPGEYIEAASFLKTIKGSIKRVDDELIDPLRESKRGLQKLWDKFTKAYLTPLKKAEEEVKNLLADYDAEQERLRQEEEDRLQAKRDAEARKEKERLEKRAGTLKTPELIEEAKEAAEEVVAPVVNVKSKVPEVEGISKRKIWKAKEVDKRAYIEAALAEPSGNMMAFILLDMKGLDKIAKATSGTLKYPGIKFYQETSIASKGE